MISQEVNFLFDIFYDLSTSYWNCIVDMIQILIVKVVEKLLAISAIVWYFIIKKNDK